MLLCAAHRVTGSDSAEQTILTSGQQQAGEERKDGSGINQSIWMDGRGSNPLFTLRVTNQSTKQTLPTGHDKKNRREKSGYMYTGEAGN
jgi:hypothetical protein